MGLFIFNKSLVSSRSAKDGTADIDLFAAPVQNLANVTSTEGLVTLYFKDGNSFTAFTGGTTNVRGYEYAQVELSVNVGDEQFVVRELGKLLSQIQKGERTTITVDVPQETYSILGVTGINSIKRFNDLTTLTTDPSSGGASLPTGGVIDQVLTKQSATDGDADWAYPHTLYVTVRNVSGGTLPKGTPVHANDVTGNVADVIAADASSASAMPCTYVLNEEIDNNDQGIAILTGTITGVDTSSFSPGDVVYVASGGGFTNVKPTGTNLIQNLGVVTKSNASTGSGVIYGTGRSNDVPNLPSGKFFIGSATNTTESAYALPTTSGTSGQVLTTDGTDASWQDVSVAANKTAYIFHYADTGTSSKFFVADTLTELASEDYRTRTPMVEAGEITKAMITCGSGANGSNYRLNIYLNGVATYSANATADTVAGDGRMQFTFSSATVSAGDVVSFRISGTASATAALPVTIGSAVLCVIKQDS